MKKNNNIKIVVINTIGIFFFMFLASNMYKWFPNNLIAFIFPVNESLFEHLKMMFISQIIVSFITYIILRLKKIKINNYFLALLVSTLLTIIIYFIIYLPIYNRLGENLFLNMGIYIIVLIITECIFYLIVNKYKNKTIFNAISIIIILVIILILGYLTYNPLKIEFFFDPIDEIYGIKK